MLSPKMKQFRSLVAAQQADELRQTERGESRASTYELSYAEGSNVESVCSRFLVKMQTVLFIGYSPLQGSLL